MWILFKKHILKQHYTLIVTQYVYLSMAYNKNAYYTYKLYIKTFLSGIKYIYTDIMIHLTELRYISTGGVDLFIFFWQQCEWWKNMNHWGFCVRQITINHKFRFLLSCMKRCLWESAILPHVSYESEPNQCYDM